MRLFDSNGRHRPIIQVQCWAKFLDCCDKYVALNDSSEGVNEQILAVKGKCHTMLQEAFAQILDRLPPSVGIFGQLSILNPKYVLSQTNRPAISELPLPNLNEKKHIQN